METTTLPFVTEDMTLVTVLKMRGIEPADTEQVQRGLPVVLLAYSHAGGDRR
jgi:hypothetical protein